MKPKNTDQPVHMGSLISAVYSFTCCLVNRSYNGLAEKVSIQVQLVTNQGAAPHLLPPSTIAKRALQLS